MQQTQSRGAAPGKDWKGEPTFPQDVMNARVKKCYDAGLQVLFHANGDAAIPGFRG